MEGTSTEELRNKAMELTKMALEHKGCEVNLPKKSLGQDSPDLVAWNPETNRLSLVIVNACMLGAAGQRSEDPSLERFEKMAVSCLADLIEDGKLRANACNVTLDVADVAFTSTKQAFLRYRPDVLRDAKAA